MKLKIVTFLFLASFFTTFAFATDSPMWVGPANVETITVQPNGLIYLRLAASVPDLGCPGNAEGWLEFDTNAPHFKEQFALVMAAHMAGKQVTIYVNFCGHYPYAQNTQVN